MSPPNCNQILSPSSGLVPISHKELQNVPAGASVIVSKHQPFWSARALPQLLRTLSPTLYFTPSGIPPAGVPCLTAVMVHDMAVYHDPASFSALDRLRLTTISKKAAKDAVILFTPSTYTKEEVMKYWGISKEKITVVPHGLSKLSEKEVPIEGIDPSIPIIAYIGRVERKKNVMILLDMISKIDTPCQLVLAGKRGVGAKQIVARSSDRTHFVGYISDEQRSWLLHHAKMLCVPCPIEGFGIPVLEGFEMNVPVLCANSGALPEVAGDAVLYAPANDSNVWAQNVETLLTEGNAKLVAAGRDRLRDYSWDTTAELTAQALLTYLQ